MSEMVERVARAIYGGPIPWEAIDPASQKILLRDARAAIEAMREPTEAMSEVGRIIVGPTYEAKSLLRAREADICWRAMIDAALRKGS